jgi:lipid II isoglutaminyl synthase (glutamine-hydrolysing)
MRLRVGHLYPDIMCTYGDRGNVETVLRRCGWRDIDVTLTELRIGDRIDPGELDLILIGSGGESQLRLIATDLYKVKGGAIREAVAQGAAVLAVGGGFELFGRYCEPGEGAELRGISVFDAWTVRPTATRADNYRTISAAQADRAIGDLVVRWRGRLLLGFENRSGGTYLGPQARPLGRVISGYGNNGDGTEGVLAGSAVGTNLRGPCLPRNPQLADFLIAAALRRRYSEAPLPPLADELELAARQAAATRARHAHRAARASLARSALRQNIRTILAGRPRSAISAPRGVTRHRVTASNRVIVTYGGRARGGFAAGNDVTIRIRRPRATRPRSGR